MLHSSPFALLRWLTLAAFMFSVGCDSGSGGAKSLKALGIDDGAALGESTEALVTEDEEAVLSLKTGAQVKIPQGAVTKDVTISLKRPADKEALALVKNLDRKQKIASAPYVITPHGTEFTQDVEVTLPVARGRDANKLKVVWLEDEDTKEWKTLGKPSVADGKATIKVKHFSVFALVEETPDPLPGGTDASARALARLTQCGLVEKQGDYAAVVLNTPAEECAFNCQLALNCERLETLICGTEDGSGLTEDLSSCLADCGVLTTCNDGSEIPQDFLCDGEPDCAGGEDEQDCSGLSAFECGDGSTVPTNYTCDGYVDCEDGSDEGTALCQGKLFTCDDGEQIPSDGVCDFYPDCSDGSDEPARCAKLVCDPAWTSSSGLQAGGVATEG